MDAKYFLVPNKLGRIVKLSSPHYLPIGKSLTTLLMKCNG